MSMCASLLIFFLELLVRCCGIDVMMVLRLEITWVAVIVQGSCQQCMFIHKSIWYLNIAAYNMYNVENKPKSWTMLIVTSVEYFAITLLLINAFETRTLRPLLLSFLDTFTYYQANIEYMFNYWGIIISAYTSVYW